MQNQVILIMKRKYKNPMKSEILIKLVYICKKNMQKTNIKTYSVKKLIYSRVGCRGDSHIGRKDFVGNIGPI